MKNIYTENPYIKEIAAAVEQVRVIKKKPALALAENIFYPGGGGQPWDTGLVRLPTGERIRVERVLKQEGIVFACLAEKTEIEPGIMVETCLDWDRRFKFMRLHTGAHVLMAAISKNLGGYAAEGIEIAEDGSGCEARFSADWDAESAVAERIMAQANGIIGENRPVECREFDSLAEIVSTHPGIYRGPRNISGPARVVIIRDWDANPCGGTHVRSLAEIGTLTLKDFSSSAISFSIE